VNISVYIFSQVKAGPGLTSLSLSESWSSECVRVATSPARLCSRPRRSEVATLSLSSALVLASARVCSVRLCCCRLSLCCSTVSFLGGVCLLHAHTHTHINNSSWQQRKYIREEVNLWTTWPKWGSDLYSHRPNQNGQMDCISTVHILSKALHSDSHSPIHTDTYTHMYCKSSNNGRRLYLLSRKEHQAFVGDRLILEAGHYFLKFYSHGHNPLISWLLLQNIAHIAT